MWRWWSVARWRGWRAHRMFLLPRDSGPIRRIVPYGPGGITDVTARTIAQPMCEDLGQQIIVENRAGGATIPAFELIAKSKSNGYTIVAATSALAAQPILFHKLPY